MILNSPFMLENLKKCGWIKTIRQRRVGQYSSTVIWKTHCQLSQMLDCSCCCKGWHFQLLDLGAMHFSCIARQVWTAFFLIKIKSLFQNCILYVLGLSLCNIHFFDDLNHSSVTYAKNEKKKERGKNFFTPLHIIYIYIYIYIYTHTHTHTHTHTQVHLNKLECRGKVNLFQ